METLQEKIETFKKENPQVSTDKVDKLVKEVAKDCMQNIVSNEEFNGRGENAWWTIMEKFNIEVSDETEILPTNRTDKGNGLKFRIACTNGDIETIKICLKDFCQINFNENSSGLTEAIRSDNLETLKFFIEDDFINRNPLYKNQVGFEYVKGQLFVEAYYYEKKDILQYLINEHHAETTVEAKTVLKDSRNDVLKAEVLTMIQNKHLNFMLEVKLQEKTDVKLKKKM